VQAVAHDYGLPRDVVKTAQAGDKFSQSIKPGTASSKSVYFVDEEELILRRRMNGEHQLVVLKSLTHKVIQIKPRQLIIQVELEPWTYCAHASTGQECVVR
jgi:hypothetical protein